MKPKDILKHKDIVCVDFRFLVDMCTESILNNKNKCV